jgi:hypothetical protein
VSEKIKGYAERLAKLLADGSSLKEALALIEPEKPVRQAPPILVRSKRRRDEN